MRSEGASADPIGTAQERELIERLACALYDAFCTAQTDSEPLVSGNPAEGGDRETIIDGTFDLREVAKIVVAALSLQRRPT